VNGLANHFFSPNFSFAIQGIGVDLYRPTGGHRADLGLKTSVVVATIQNQ
jgi:hypothetical protein